MSVRSRSGQGERDSDPLTPDDSGRLAKNQSPSLPASRPATRLTCESCSRALMHARVSYFLLICLCRNRFGEEPSLVHRVLHPHLTLSSCTCSHQPVPLIHRHGLQSERHTGQHCVCGGDWRCCCRCTTQRKCRRSRRHVSDGQGAGVEQRLSLRVNLQLLHNCDVHMGGAIPVSFNYPLRLALCH
jgi:hypothetical protein